ncbi:MAG: efflux RND transporter periplasmic adaptor subunit [Candidatus Moraniibacteriota bacterium]
MFTKKRVIIGIVIAALVAGFFYYRSQNGTVAVQTETVRQGDVSETVSVTGELVPQAYADLAFQGVGVVDQVLVKEGERVTAGAKIASLDRAVLWSQLKEARIALAIVEQSDKQAHLRRNSSGKSWDDLKPEERAAIKLKTEQARESVRTLEAEMRESVIYAPLDGQVTKLDLRVGETVTLGKIIGRVATSGDFVIEARVPESDIVKVTPEMRSKITFDAFSADEIFDAAVVEIDKASTVIQDVVSYVVKFRLDNTDPRLKEGMTANIDIETAKRENVLTIPFRALTKESGKTFAAVKQSDGTFVKTEVTTGLEGDDGTIEIRSGLQAGNEVTIGATQTK